MRLWLLVAVVMVGCGTAPLPGAPKLGSSCTADMKRECYTESEFAFCDNGVWASYPCEGRCSNAQTPRCQVKIPRVGEACPASWENFGTCLSDTEMAVCNSEKWTSRSCRCQDNNGFVTCG